MNSRMYFLSSVLFLIVISCSGKKESLPVSNEGIEVPFQEFGQAALYFYNKDYVQWKLESEIMRKPITDTGHILVTPVRLTMFDSVGNATTRVLSDSGSTDGSMESFIVWGNVFIRARDSW